MLILNRTKSVQYSVDQSLTSLAVDFFVLPTLAIWWCRHHPSGCQLLPTMPSQLLPHVLGTTCRPTWRLLSGLHSANSWKPVSFPSHFPEF